MGLPLESVAGSLKCGRSRRTLRLYAKALKAVFLHFCFVTLFETHLPVESMLIFVAETP